MASGQSLPNNIILKIGENLNARDFCALLRTNKHIASVLTPFLPGLACQPLYACNAVSVSRKCGNEEMVRLLMHHGEMSCMRRYWSSYQRRKPAYLIKRGGSPPPVLRRIPPTLKDWQTNHDLMHLMLPEEFLSVKEGWFPKATRR